NRWRMRHKNGDWRWLLCRGGSQPDPDGSPRRFVGVFTDVTEQVETEQGLSELTRRNEILLTSAGEGFLGIDERGTITFANPAAGQFLGRAVQDLVGKRITEAFPHSWPSDVPCQPETRGH